MEKIIDAKLKQLSSKLNTKFYCIIDIDNPDDSTCEYFIYEKYKNDDILWFSIFPVDNHYVLSVYDLFNHYQKDFNDVKKFHQYYSLNDVFHNMEHEYIKFIHELKSSNNYHIER